MAFVPAVVVPAVEQFGFTCPCGDSKVYMVSHLTEAERAGPWGCYECNVKWYVEWHQEFTIRRIILQDSGKRVAKILHRFTLDGAEKPLTIFSEGITTWDVNKGETLASALNPSGTAYYLMDGTCPTNICKDIIAVFNTQSVGRIEKAVFQNAVEIFWGEEIDPHSIFTLRETYEWADIHTLPTTALDEIITQLTSLHKYVVDEELYVQADTEDSGIYGPGGI